MGGGLCWPLIGETAFAQVAAIASDVQMTANRALRWLLRCSAAVKKLGCARREKPDLIERFERGEKA